MKAIVYTKYGPPDNLELKEVEKPTPKDNEVRVKVFAASLNAADLDFLRGRLQPPFSRKPRFKILGSDIAGIVDTVGKDVTHFQPGDEVYGDLFSCGLGAFAEYVCAPEKALLLKPASMTFDDVSTLPQAGILALQGLRNKKQTQPGQKILINGAGGGLGTFAVQIAKFYGAEVTGVDSADKLEMVRSIGADHVIDFNKEDFTKSEQRYDLIIDVVAHLSIFDYKRVLSPKGIYIVIGGSMATILKILFLGPLITMFGGKKMSVLAWRQMKKEDLDFMSELCETGKVVPVIDRRYPLSEVADAFRYLEEGHHQGKIVITVENNSKS